MLILIGAIYVLALVIVFFFPATTAFFEGRLISAITNTFFGVVGLIAGIYIVGTIPNLFG